MHGNHTSGNNNTSSSSEGRAHFRLLHTMCNWYTKVLIYSQYAFSMRENIICARWCLARRVIMGFNIFCVLAHFCSHACKPNSFAPSGVSSFSNDASASFFCMTYHETIRACQRTQQFGFTCNFFVCLTINMCACVCKFTCTSVYEYTV